jgi:hypothetical protein
MAMAVAAIVIAFSWSCVAMIAVIAVLLLQSSDFHLHFRPQMRIKTT